MIGVLSDYDLSSMKSVPSGRERTGTVPFMALELLIAEAIQGDIEYLYQHDAESFIWVLTWVSLRCDGGKLLDEGPGRQFDEWLTVNAKGCRESKSDFLFRVQRHVPIDPPSSHQYNWQIALSCLRAFFSSQGKDIEGQDVFRDWLDTKVPSSRRE